MALPGNKNFSDYDNYVTDPNPTTSAQAQDYFRNQAELLKAVIDCDFWQPETVYQPGHVVKSDSMPNGTEAVMVATKAGVTSNVEPQWGAVGGANISDGACFWKLRWKHWSKENATNRLPNTSYAVGNVVYDKSNLSVALKCTTAGTTSNTELDVSGNNAGDTVTDGSVVWKVIERNIADGGVVTGNITVENFANVGFRQIHPTTKADLRFGIGAGGNNRGIYDGLGGWRFLLTDDGNVVVSASDGYTTKQLVCKPDGTFTFDDKNVLTASGLVNNADLNSITKAGTYLVRKGSATEAQGWTSNIWGTNGFLEVFAGAIDSGGYYIKQVYRRCGTSDSNDWQVCTRQSGDGGVTWGEWRRIDNGGEQRTLANTGYYLTADGLVFAWARVGSGSAPAVVNKPIPFTTYVAQPTDSSNSANSDRRVFQWDYSSTTETTDTFSRYEAADAFTVFWVGKAV